MTGLAWCADKAALVSVGMIGQRSSAGNRVNGMETANTQCTVIDCYRVTIPRPASVDAGAESSGSLIHTLL